MRRAAVAMMVLCRSVPGSRATTGCAAAFASAGLGRPALFRQCWMMVNSRGLRGRAGHPYPHPHPHPPAVRTGPSSWASVGPCRVGGFASGPGPAYQCGRWASSGALAAGGGATDDVDEAVSSPRPSPMSAVMLGQEYVAGLAYDLETTSADPETTEVVQIAIVAVNSRTPDDPPTFTRLVLPEGPIEPGAAAVHGYTRERLVEEGARPFDEVWDECEHWLSETFGDKRPLVWAAHNGNRFDLPILTRLVREHLGDESCLTDKKRAVYFDTLPVARSAIKDGRSGRGSFTLGRLFEDATGDALDGAHDALVDVQALSTVWKWLVEEKGADRRLGPEHCFQHHLQFSCYPQDAPPLPPMRTVSRRPAGTSGGGGGASSVRLADSPPLEDVPGIGPTTVRKLAALEIHSTDDLVAAWRERGSDSKTMRGWLVQNLKGIHPTTISKVVRALEAEFPWVP